MIKGISSKMASIFLSGKRLPLHASHKDDLSKAIQCSVNITKRAKSKSKTNDTQKFCI